ncbi:MAG: tetratricopeptide repeat protein [Defluviitaleaceae bacterium]|nr:tetratricopeptide repeat protein [Defluviitaleaceae bacterium]
MQCPNCEKEYNEGSICPNCKVDPVLYAGTVRLSDKLYNKGLSKLNNSDLTQGIELLNRSVSVNKNNVPARNLLGLALFEIGYVGEALKHWVVSQSLLKENNPASHYVEEARKNSRALEDLNDAALKYNQALTYLKQKSDDLAIIQLKRAVELNPKFVDALNLLALCHLIQNDREKAAAASERVLAIDIQNPVALNYLSILTPNRARTELRKPQGRITGRKESASGSGKTASFTRPVPVTEKKQRSFRLDIILAFVIGAACSFAVVYVLLFPALHRQNESQIQTYRDRLSDARDARDEDARQHEATMEEMNSNLEEMRQSLDEWEALYDIQDRMIRFQHIENLYRDGQLLEAINRLDELDMTDMSLEIASRADAIRASAYPVLSTQFMNEGIAAFNANDFYKALVDLEMAVRFMTEDSPRPAAFLMALGRLYTEDETRHAEARELFEELQARFPNHMPLTRNQYIARLTDLD